MRLSRCGLRYERFWKGTRKRWQTVFRTRLSTIVCGKHRAWLTAYAQAVPSAWRLEIVETVAFYSYKGGVGRSMLLANAARYLASAGKGVVALDFDFEAPGLHYKFVGDHDPVGGAVAYLAAIAEGTTSPPPLDDHIVTVQVPTDTGGWLRLMPAGPAPHPSYWAALKQLGDRLRLTDLSGRGFMALLDLQARIADELKPDYLLIDARTGVTELGGLATTVLADTVVCMFVANQESLDGTRTVIEALSSTSRLANQKPIRVVPVLSRAPATLTRHEPFVLSIWRRIAPRSAGDVSTLFVLPHDDKLETFEERPSKSPLYEAYIELFQSIFLSTSPAGN